MRASKIYLFGAFLILISCLVRGLSIAAEAAPSPLIAFKGKTAETVRASGVELPVYPEAQLTGGSTRLYLTGKGLREKQIAFFSANVYIAISYVDDAKVAELSSDPKLPLAEVLKKVLACKNRALQLHLVRDVGADKIRDAFRDSMKDNQIPVGEGSRADKILSQIQTELKKGDVITLTASGDGKTETLKLALPTKTIVVNEEGVADDFWKIWFGKSEDGSLKRLQLQLLGRAPFPS
jgi:hypothetical protein